MSGETGVKGSPMKVLEVQSYKSSLHSGNLIKFRGPETPVRCRWRAACSYYFNRKGAPGDGSTGSMRREGAQPGRGGVRSAHIIT